MAKKFLIDTGILVLHASNKLSTKVLADIDEIMVEGFAYSSINRIELFGFSRITIEEQLKLSKYLTLGREESINENVVKKTIEIRNQRSIKISDAIIAATAIVGNYTLITDNGSDFKGIEGLQLEDLS